MRLVRMVVKGMVDTNSAARQHYESKNPSPQLKAHVQPWPATSQIYQVERTAQKARCVDMILKENPNSFPINYVPRVSFLHRKLDLWKTVASPLNPPAQEQTSQILDFSA